MAGENRPLSQIFKETAYDWQDKEKAAKILEDTKSAIMAQRQAMLGDIPVNKAEQTVKASQWWHDHCIAVVEARTEANKAWIEVEYIKMKFQEWTNAEANHRAEARL